MSLFAFIMYGRYHGKGIKYSRNNELEKALNSYLKALKYAKKTKNEGLIALELECVALIYHKRHDDKSAKQYAEMGLKINQEFIDDDISFKNGAYRLKKLLSQIDQKRSDTADQSSSQP